MELLLATHAKWVLNISAEDMRSRLQQLSPNFSLASVFRPSTPLVVMSDGVGQDSPKHLCAGLPEGGQGHQRAPHRHRAQVDGKKK